MEDICPPLTLIPKGTGGGYGVGMDVWDGCILTDFKNANWIAALIYVSKKKAMQSFWLYVKECSFVSNTCKKCSIEMNLTN